MTLPQGYFPVKPSAWAGIHGSGRVQHEPAPAAPVPAHSTTVWGRPLPVSSSPRPRVPARCPGGHKRVGWRSSHEPVPSAPVATLFLQAIWGQQRPSSSSTQTPCAAPSPGMILRSRQGATPRKAGCKAGQPGAERLDRQARQSASRQPFNPRGRKLCTAMATPQTRFVGTPAERHTKKNRLGFALVWP